MSAALNLAVAEAVGEPVTASTQVPGGDISNAYRLTLSSGREIFVKHRPDAPDGMFSAEAHGLDWLRPQTPLRIPGVVAIGERVPFLALEWIAPGAPAADHDERLGRGLATLHRANLPEFGLARDNFVATIAQANAPSATWPEFYAARRLGPLVRAVRDRGAIDPATVAGFDVLFARLVDLCGPDEPPARLHGDLWGGNAIVDASGSPVLIDPAVYGGHREVDLAMMRLFGGFGARVFDAYDEAYPRAPGHSERVGLYQLWPLLVHVALFGGGYVARLQRALRRYV